MSEMKLKKYGVVQIYVDDFSGAFRARVSGKELATSSLFELEKALDVLQKTESNKEPCYVYDYLYKLCSGNILSFDTDYVNVEVDKGYKQNTRVKCDEVFPKNKHNDELFDRIEDFKRNKREQERKFDDLISVQLEKLQHHPTDYFEKKILEKIGAKK